MALTVADQIREHLVKAAVPLPNTDRAGSATEEGSRPSPSSHLAPYWTDGTADPAWPGERVWTRICVRYPRAAPAAAIAFIAAWLMFAFLVGGR